MRRRFVEVQMIGLAEYKSNTHRPYWAGRTDNRDAKDSRISNVARLGGRNGLVSHSIDQLLVWLLKVPSD